MNINPNSILPKKVTIINKLKKTDSIIGQEIWYKTILDDCFWNVTTQSQQSGTSTYLGESISVQIPFIQKQKYIPYRQWCKSANPDTTWTVSQNDYIILGEVVEEVTPQTITQVVAKYEPNTCKIQLFEDLTTQGMDYLGNNNFLEKYANIYYVEGV